MRFVIAILIATTAIGCTSMRSTSLTRQADDSYVKNGVPTKGVPITVRVPSHLQLAVVETLYYENKEKDTTTGGIDLELLPDELFKYRRNIKVKSTIIKTSKVITVDMKRPAAGTLEYNLGFDPDRQYITQIESFLYDRTLSDTANLIAAVVPGATQDPAAPQTVQPGFDLHPTEDPFATEPFENTFILGSRPDPKSNTPVIGSVIAPKIMTKERVVAIRIFDISECDFEQQVQAFLEHHVNQCHNCATDACAQPSPY